MSVKPILAHGESPWRPDGYHSVTPYLIVDGGAAALDFYQKAFSASEMFRMQGPDGKIAHAEIKIGDSPIMLADGCPEAQARSPEALQGTSIGICIYVEECDAVFERAVAAGATVAKPLADQFYGDRSGTVIDPFGHLWTISTHKEDLTPEEIEQRASEWMSQQESAG